MKKNMSKILSLVLAAMMTVTCFVGCGNDKETTTSQSSAATESTVTSESTATSETTVAPVEMETITIWTNDASSQAFVVPVVDEYNNGEGKEKGIFIDYQLISGDSFATSLELALQTGQGPDLYMAAGNTGKKYAESGYTAAFEDIEGGLEWLDAMLAKLGLGKDALAINKNIYNGKTYSVPYTVTTRGLIYNKDLFKAAGLVDEKGEAKPPKTFDEFREYAKILTDESKGVFGTILPMKWSGWVGSDMTDLIMSSTGHDGFNPVTGVYEYDNLAPIIETFEGIIADGSAYPGAEGIDNDTARAYFAEGLVGMKMAYSFDVGVLTDQFPAKCDWGVAPLPVLDAENTYMQKMSVDNSYSINAASVKTKDPAKLLAVVEFFAGPELCTAMFENGYKIPVTYDFIKDVELDDSMANWKAFAELATISHGRNTPPNTDMTGYLALKDRILQQVLPGTVSAEDMVAQYNIDITDAKNKYYGANTTEFDYAELFLDDTWNIAR